MQEIKRANRLARTLEGTRSFVCGDCASPHPAPGEASPGPPHKEVGVGLGWWLPLGRVEAM